jgi:hypothetical protein
VGNLKRRLERLEGGRKRPSVAVIMVKRGETNEEALQREVAADPETEKAEVKIFIKGRDQDPPSAPPPPRPEPKESTKAPGPAAISITK